MNTENAILGQYGLLFIFLSNAEWEALPGNLLHAAVHTVPAGPGGAAAVAAVPTQYSRTLKCKQITRRQFIEPICLCVQK